MRLYLKLIFKNSEGLFSCALAPLTFWFVTEFIAACLNDNHCEIVCKSMNIISKFSHKMENKKDLWVFATNTDSDKPVPPPILSNFPATSIRTLQLEKVKVYLSEQRKLRSACITTQSYQYQVDRSFSIVWCFTPISTIFQLYHGDAGLFK